MLVAASLLFANAAGAAITPRAGGVEVAAARIAAEILHPAVVRQQSGWERGRGDGPRPQITSRGGTVLIEFQ